MRYDERPQRPTALSELLSQQTIARIARLDIHSRKVFAGKLQGERRSKRRGESVEFADHRPYSPGDDLRHIDWNIVGRLDKLFMKVFLEDEDLALHLIVDASASSDCGNPTKFLFMQQLAAALGYIGLVNLNRVTLSTIAGSPFINDDTSDTNSSTTHTDNDQHSDRPPVTTIRDLRGRRRLVDLERWLLSTQPQGSADFTEAAKRIALTRAGKGVTIIMSDFLFKDGYEPGLRMLAGRGYDIICLQVLSPQEIEPDIVGDLKLRDIEDGHRTELTVSAPLLKQYKATLDTYCDTLRHFCASRDMLHILAPSDTPVERVLLDSFRRHGVVR